MDISGAFLVCMVWISVCTIAGLMALGLIWIGMKMFANSNDAFDSLLEKKVMNLESRVKELEAKARELNAKREED